GNLRRHFRGDGPNRASERSSGSGGSYLGDVRKVIGPGLLWYRKIRRWRRGSVEVIVFGVADNTHHFVHSSALFAFIVADRAAEGVPVGEELARGCQVKDDLEAGGSPCNREIQRWRVVPGEFASGEQRDAHRAEVGGRHSVHPCVVICAARIGKILVPFAAVEKRYALIGDAASSGLLPETLGHFAVEVHQGLAP